MIFRFDDFELDTAKHELRSAGSALHVEPRIFAVLAYLVRHRDRMVSKHELIEQLWDGRAVSDWTISGSIKSSRSALGDNAKTKRYIRTIHGQGYRFIADALAIEDGDTGSAPGNSTSIAVLPFVNLSGQADQDYLSDGITEDLITDLGNIDGLIAVSRNAAFAFRGSDNDVQTVSRRLNARFLLQGSVRQSGRTIRINTRLVDGSNGAQLWAERFDGEPSDIFALQDRISARVVTSLKLNLLPSQSGHRGRGTSNSQAYDHCLRGRSEYYLYTPAHLAKAQAHFERAVECDPDYAEAYAYQSYCRTSAYVFTWPGSDATLDTAIELAQRAIALDPASAIAHARLGWVLGFVDRFEEATGSFETAGNLDPRSAEVFYAYGETMNRRADPHKALALLKTAFEIDTYVPPSWQFAKGHSHVLMRDIDGVLSNILPVLERVPGFIPARVQLARAYHDAGQNEDARKIVQSIRNFAPKYRLLNAARMFPYPVTAERDRMISALREAGLPE
ncbi:MAG: winged helix-turn-helix domain-containing protein [Alphaproteobacteria bacterium]|nr:winged helix-turn-helix domain-containing protein [Alphaproteobacteria bacterium]